MSHFEDTHSSVSVLPAGVTAFAEKALLSLGVLTLLLVIPFFVNFMITTKVLVLLVGAIVLMALFVFSSISSRSLRLPTHPFLLPLLLFGISSIISSLTTNSYPIENLLGFGGVYISFVVIAFCGGLVLTPRSSTTLVNYLSVGLIILAVSTMLQFVGFGPSRLLNLISTNSTPDVNIFNLSGSVFIAAQVFGLGVLMLGYEALRHRKLNSLEVAALVMSAIGLALSVYLSLPGQDGAPLILPLSISWSMALDALHNLRTAIVGVGPEQYISVYSQFRPLWTNDQTWWNVLFSQGSNLPLTLMVTHGLVGLAAWGFLAVRMVLQARTRAGVITPVMTLSLGILVLQLIFPNNIVLITLQALGLAAWIASEKAEYPEVDLRLLHIIKRPHREETAGNPSQLSGLIAIVVAVLIGGSGLYFVGRAYAASVAFYRASVALQNNDGAEGYRLQQQAVNLNPYISSYRNSYALTNLAIAAALSNKADLTAEERSQVAQLLQQAVREGRAATVLRPDLSNNWQVLGQIYRNLIGSAEGAEDWTITSYSTAAQTAPTDPQIRVELGLIMFQLQRYQEAGLLFQQAAELKPDLASAYYNLARVYKELKQWELAQAAYQQTLTLIEPNTDAYTVTTAELEEVEKEVAKLPPAQGQGSQQGSSTGQNRQPSSSPTPSAAPAASPAADLPPITQQNLTNSDADVVNQPGEQPLTVQPPSSLPQTDL
ncbi:MAG TPA: tetratricopeptide repeat protein [Vitreimonas sp.]|nr:tetratricopeptide repeat protein [Vitreimonas sp.]